MSKVASANGSCIPLPSTVRGAIPPSPDSSPTSASRAKYVAPAPSNAVRK